MDSDNEAIQGLWKIDSMISRGQTVGHGDTHWQFDGNRVQKIMPTYVDGGSWATFVLDPTTHPKRMDTTHEIPNRDSGTTTPRTFKECYELSGDTLRIGGAEIFGQYPPEISDAVSMVTTLTRFHGPRPETKKASGIVPVENPVLGTVTWDDNSEQWDARAAFTPDQLVNISLSPLDENEENTIENGALLVEWARTHDADARAYAAKQMTSLAEDWRDEDEEPGEITPETFAARIKLSEISVESTGEANLWYHDDDIFAGHVIVVYVDNNRNFTDAQMMG